MELSELQLLANKLDQLIQRCHKLESDKVALRHLQDDWQRERSHLLQQNDIARHKIEAMIGRLKALE